MIFWKMISIGKYENTVINYIEAKNHILPGNFLDSFDEKFYPCNKPPTCVLNYRILVITALVLLYLLRHYGRESRIFFVYHQL